MEAIILHIDRRIVAGLVVFILLAFAGGMKYESIHAQREMEAKQTLIQESNMNDLERFEKKKLNIIQVYVSGEVKKPGVYSLREGDRLYQAVEMAGGTTAQADVKHLELARPLADGETIYIPTPGEVASQSTSLPAVAGGAGQTRPGGMININSATVEELDQGLDGIGPALAQRIVDYRNTNGPFANIEDIKNVSGIGDKKFAAIKDKICTR